MKFHFVVTMLCLATSGQAHSGPPASYLGNRGDFSRDAPACTGGGNTIAPMAPLGSCVANRMTGFPNQCRLITGRPQKTFSAGERVQYPINVVALHYGTCGYIHLTGSDIMDASKWINLTPNRAFCIEEKNGRYETSLGITIPNVAPGVYNLCFLAWAGVQDQVDSRYPDTSNQHHAYQACGEVRINNPNPGNFVAQAMYVVDMGEIYLGNENERSVFQAQDGFTWRGDDPSGAKRLTWLRQKVNQEGTVAYCAQDGRLHSAANAANACNAPVYRVPNVRANQCNAFRANTPPVAAPTTRPPPANSPTTRPPPAASPTRPPTKKTCTDGFYGLYEQCGGKGFQKTGDRCCPDGSRCNSLNEFHSQCQPTSQQNGIDGPELASTKSQISTGSKLAIGVGACAVFVGAAIGAVMIKKKRDLAKQMSSSPYAPRQTTTTVNPQYIGNDLKV